MAVTSPPGPLVWRLTKAEAERQQIDRPMLTDDAILVYEMLCDTLPIRGLLGREIVERLHEEHKRYSIDESILTKRIIPFSMDQPCAWMSHFCWMRLRSAPGAPMMPLPCRPPVL